MCQKGLRRVRRPFEPDTDSEPGQVGSEDVGLSHYEQGAIVSTVEQAAQTADFLFLSVEGWHVQG